jgi:hypothetical protein
MGDLADDAGDVIDRATENSVAAVREAGPDAVATGECLYCAATLPPPQRWCDADCCRGWEHERKRRRGQL